MEGTFPQEIWAEILKHCPHQTIVVLTRVCPIIQAEALKILLRSVVSNEPSAQGEEPLGTIHEPWAFYRMLNTTETDWRRLIRSVKLNWLPEHVDNGGNNALPGKEKPIEEHIIFKTAMLLSECPYLHDFQLNLESITTATAMIKQTTLPITSLSFSLPHRYSWEDLYEVFEIPTVTTLAVRNLLSPDRPAFRFPQPIPEHLHSKVSTSNVQKLDLLEGGALTLAILPLFRWPSNLKKLIYSPARSKCEPYWRGILRRTGDISDAVERAFQALSPLHESLEELHLDLGLDRHWISSFKTEQLFRPFTRLLKLTVPVELLMQSRGLCHSRLDRPFYTNLPCTLQDLTLKFTIMTSWHPRPALSDLDLHSCFMSDPAHQLFDELSTLAMQKQEYYPALKSLTLSKDGEIPFLVKCSHTEQCLEDLQSCGIKVFQNEWCRQSKDTWI